LHHHDMGDDDTAYVEICKRHKLTFERGVRCYYVDKSRLTAVVQDLQGAGFAVALSLDAVHCAA
jgi:hypothetical protein